MGTISASFAEKSRAKLIELFVERNPYKIFKQQLLATEKTLSFAKINRVMFFREVIACYSEIHMKYNNTLREKNSDLFTVTAMVRLVSALL